MDWLTAVAVVTICAGVTISVVVLVAVGSIRRSLNEGGVRQTQQLRILTDKVAALTRQNLDAHARIDALTEANRRLAGQLAALGERDGDTGERPGGGARILH